MSRSYRKPACAVCCVRSAKDDKRHANRGVRRRQNQYLRDSQIADDYDGFLIPHTYECSFNETYSWGRDGCQSLQRFPVEGDYFCGWYFENYGPEAAAIDYQDAILRFEKLKRK